MDGCVLHYMYCYHHIAHTRYHLLSLIPQHRGNRPRGSLPSSFKTYTRTHTHTHTASCSNATQTRCECRNAGRECVSCCPGTAKCRNRHSEAAVRTPLPGMGGIYCLPISGGQPALASQPDPANDAWSPLVLTQDNFEVDELADLPNEVLTTLEIVALFQQDLEAQGTKLGHGNTTGHNANDSALTGDNVGTDLGTQATGASEYGNTPPRSNSA